MKKRVGKLELHRETVRTLTVADHQALENAVGGTFGTTIANSWTSCAGGASCDICPQV